VGSNQIQQSAKCRWFLKRISLSLFNSHDLCHQRQGRKGIKTVRHEKKIKESRILLRKLIQTRVTPL
jgi:hypothetical protein